MAEIYEQVHQSMIQMPIKDNVPLFWSTMALIKTNHYRSMAHFFVASALLDHQRKRIRSNVSPGSPEAPERETSQHLGHS